MPRITRYSILLVVLLLGGAVLAHAGTAGPTSTRPDPQRVTGRSASAFSARPLTAEEHALASVQLAGQRRVEALMRQLAGSTQGAAINGVQRLVEQAKRETEVQLLQTKSTFARGRGDFAAVRDLDLRIDQLAHPRPNAHAGEAAAAKPAAVEGGRR